MKFNIINEKDDESRYVTEYPGLPGCLSEGAELRAMLENVLADVDMQ
jgi:predicted RNase H-like HicB family nuclease